MTRRSTTLVLILMLPLVPATLAPQAPRYTAAALACARFSEQVESAIHGESGGRPRDDTGGRSAVWRVRSVAGAGPAFEIEAWYESLDIWRTTNDVRRSPDTDGIIGGRYRGSLTELGAYAASARPFVPDEVAEFADLRDAFADLLPALPDRPLRPGESWRDGQATVIQRLGDSLASSRRIQRFRLERETDRRDTTLVVRDTVPVPLRQHTVESGEFSWEPERGLLGRVRRITVSTDIPAGRGLRYPVRSRLVQRVVVVRLPDVPDACRNSR
ncbi:MAG: hypothetical protein H0U85_06345 [Gemmatimonadales bacterium]|nr:hypothetical protein [Gemmatimonadales bacterium]